MKRLGLMNLQTISALAVCLAFGAKEGYSEPVFYSTTDASDWQVATNVGGTDGSFSSFPTTGFVTATTVTGRFTGTTGWIANNSTGTNAPDYNWTFFVFRQTFDLTGYDATTADLQFQWAADDSGQGFAGRGTWIPKYSLNGGSLVTGIWPGGNSYSFGPTVDISSGFVPGQNVIEFYVEGNGVSDGLALNPTSFMASAVPEPASMTLLGIAVASGLGFFGLRRRKLAKAGVMENSMKRIPLMMTLCLVILAVPQVKASTTYDAVADFSIAANPNGQWSYLYKDGSAPQLLPYIWDINGPGVNSWWDGQVTPDVAAITKNTTASPVTLSNTIVLPPNLLDLGPEHNSAITRWTAPSAGSWSIGGLFQGIDIYQTSHTVEVLENSTTMLLAPTTISSYGQAVNFSAYVSLAKGDTIDFIVNGATNYNNLSTGLSATIVSSVPEPSSIVLGLIASVACGSLY